MWWRVIKLSGKKELLSILPEENIKDIRNLFPQNKFQAPMAYFFNQGISLENLNVLYQELALIDSKRPINIMGSASGVKLGDKKFTDFDQLQSYIRSISSTIGNKPESKNESYKQQAEKILTTPGIHVHKLGNAQDACILGFQTDWCISQDKSTYNKYRASGDTFYVIVDNTNQLPSEYSRVAIQVEDPNHKAYDFRRPIKVWTIDDDVLPTEETLEYLHYLNKNNIPISQFKLEPKNQEEIEKESIVKEYNSSLDWFKNLSFEEKMAYIDFGNEITTPQFTYLLENKANDIIDHYLKSGISLNPEQKKMIYNDKQKYNTYSKYKMRAMKNTIDHYANNDSGLLSHIVGYQDYELLLYAYKNTLIDRDDLNYIAYLTQSVNNDMRKYAQKLLDTPLFMFSPELQKMKHQH